MRMPQDFVPDFLFIVMSTFILSAFALLLTAKSSHPDQPDAGSGGENLDDFPNEEGWEELAERMAEDELLREQAPPVHVDHLDIPGARLGGGAKEENRSKTVGAISLALREPPDEKRKYNRRLRERRVEDVPVAKDRRMMERRVWLRRKEDYQERKLLTVSEAASTLEISVEQIYKWLGDSDVPFYQITEGNRKVIRFEINELLQWYNTFISRDENAQPSGPQ
jgi:excisionase family DNA binding protein